MRRGPLGTEALNLLLQDALNPIASSQPTHARFRPGDKVMQLRNDYDREVYEHFLRHGAKRRRVANPGLETN